MKRVYKLKPAFIFFIVFLISDLSFSQESWDEMLRGENGVVLEQNQQVEISINDDGSLSIISKVYEATKHFGANTNFYREQSINYSSTFSEIRDLNAYSLIPTEKNKYKKIHVKDFITTDARSSGIFYDDQKKINYVFPALSPGSKTVFSYTKRYKEPRLWGYFMFSSFFPVAKSNFSVKVPENVELKFHQFGIDDEHVTYSEHKKGKYKIYNWTAEHVDKIRLSKGADGVLHSAPHLIIHVDSYEHEGVTHNVLGDVTDLHAWYQGFLQDVEDKENEDMKIMVENIIAQKPTELAKVEAIYDWVQQNIKYIAIEDGLGGFRPRSSNLVFNRRYGDCKDMSNLLHNMLNIAEIPSNLTWIGTKSIPYSHSEVPTPMADNHMICTYMHNGQYYFLDATDQYNTLGIPTSHIQGSEALINKGVNDFELVNVPVVPFEKNSSSDSVFFEINGSELHGSGQSIYAGYNKIPIANNLENLDEKDKKTFLNLLLKKGNNKFKLNAVTTQNVSAKNNDLIIDYKFIIEDYLISTTEELFINPHFNRELEGDLIDIATTKESIHYPFKKMTSNTYCIQLPENFELTYLPENAHYEADKFGFSIEYEVDEKDIFIKQSIKINTLQLESEQFESWNKMIKELHAVYKESIVLEKIE